MATAVAVWALYTAGPLVLAQDRAPKPDVFDAIKQRALEEARRALAERPADTPPADTPPADTPSADISSADVKPADTATAAAETPRPPDTETSAGQDDSPIIMRNADLPLYTPSEIILFLNDDGTNASALTREAGLDLVTSDRIGLLGLDMVTARLRRGDSVEAALARVLGDTRIAWAQPNYIYQLLGNSRTRGLAMHGLGPEAAQLPRGLPALGTSATIALIDSPVELTHPGLAGANIRQLGLLGNVPASPHGTAIAELLVGTGEFEGVVRGAALVSIPAFRPTPSDAQPAAGSSTTQMLVAAFQMAGDIRPDVLNLSFGTLAKRDEGIARMIAALDARGVCIAAAAGNGGAVSPVLFPASLPATIAVAAVDAAEHPYQFGSRGPEVDIAAWGVDISAAVPGGRRAVTGTSFAAPLVAGAMLRMPACSSAHRPANVRLALAMDAKDLGDTGRDTIFGAGLLRFGEGAVRSANLVPDASTDPSQTFAEPPASRGWWPGVGALALSLGLGGFLLVVWRRRQREDSTQD